MTATAATRVHGRRESLEEHSSFRSRGEGVHAGTPERNGAPLRCDGFAGRTQAEAVVAEPGAWRHVSLRESVARQPIGGIGNRSPIHCCQAGSSRSMAAFAFA